MRVGASFGSENQATWGSLESPDAFEAARTRTLSLALPSAALSNPPTEGSDNPARGKSPQGPRRGSIEGTRAEGGVRGGGGARP